MFSPGNLIGFDNNGQPVHQHINIQGYPQLNSQIQHSNNAIQYQPQMYTPSNAVMINQPMSSQNYINYATTNQGPPPMLDNTYANNEERGHHIQRMTSTSEDEEEVNETNSNEWQVIRSYKRKKVCNNKQKTTENTITLSNKFQELPNESDGANNAKEASTNVLKTPPIFVHGVQNYNEMVKRIEEIVNKQDYQTKTLVNNVVKINCKTSDTYRKLVKEFREKNIYHHTYQLKEERAYRIVIRYLHHSTNLEDIKSELTQLGHTVRNITNVLHRTTKEPLNLFFVDLEPAQNNKDIYKITGLQNRVVQIEPPRTQRNNIIQCTRCQQYGHSKSYCNKPYICVKCGGSHNTTTCSKTRDTPAKCALCGGNHPANYRGCDHYLKISKGNTKNNRQQSTVPPIYNNETYARNIQQTTTGKSYAETLKETDTTMVLNKFLDEFRNLFNQLIQQNGMVLSMMTTLINKIK